MPSDGEPVLAAGLEMFVNPGGGSIQSWFEPSNLSSVTGTGAEERPPAAEF